jgi:filamentous hemagglutinin family protein
VAYSPPSCGLPKDHDRQRDRLRHASELEFQIGAFNLLGQPMSDGVRSQKLGPLLVALLVAAPAQAQIVTDGSVGPKVSLRGGEIEIGADLGTRRGDNLFHSFEKFGIATGQTATFTGPGTIKNVISRVTGGEISNIDGTLASRVGQADLYFLNPAGVMFGPNARLDVPGSFHVSTAHELRFDDGVSFSALDKTGSSLTVAPPESFGFLDRPAGQIRVDQSHLQLNAEKTLSLVGGNIDIVGRLDSSVTPRAFMAVEGGQINLASAASAGQVRISDGTVAADRLGTIRLTNGAYITPSLYFNTSSGPPSLKRFNRNGQSPGLVRIRGGAVVIENSSGISANGTVAIDADALELRGFDSQITANAFVDGQAAGISTVSVRVGRVVISSSASVSAPGGTVTIDAGELKLLTGGKINTASLAFGSNNPALVDGGTVRVRARHLLISGDGAVAGDFSGIISWTQPGQTGNAGVVEIAADTVEMHNKAIISTRTNSNGNAGRITAQAKHLLISGDNASNARASLRDQESTGIFSGANPSSTGNGGQIEILADRVELHNGGQINTSSAGSGKSGPITITAEDTLQLNNATISAETETADASSITLNVGDLLHLRNKSKVTTSVAHGTGRGGDMSIQVPVLVLEGSDIIADALRGTSGNINIFADHVIRSSDSDIRASTELRIVGTPVETPAAGMLSVSFLDAPGLLATPCAARGGYLSNSLVAGGRGSLPPDPSVPLAANLFEQSLGQRTAAGPSTALTPRSSPAAEPVVAADPNFLLLNRPNC